MFKKLLLISALFVSGGLSTANAIPVLSFNPSSTTAILNSQITVDVVVSNLEPHFVAGYDLTFTYDPGVLSFFGGSFFGLDTIFADTGVLGEITWNSTNLSLNDAQLANNQGDSLTLASILFQTVGLVLLCQIIPTIQDNGFQVK